MVYQWFPGHMTKAIRMMQEDMKLIDLVIELVDARAPLSTRNPDIDKLSAGKARLVLLNKSDLADVSANQKWISYFRSQNIGVLEINARDGNGMKQIRTSVDEVMKEKIERDRKRGIKNRPVRAMVVGIPNVGKSTFINSFAKRASAKTGNKPGVTKGKQWIRPGGGIELLDTPGILWPKFDDQEVGLRLALIGSINDEILQMQDLAMELIRFLIRKYPKNLCDRYQIPDEMIPAEEGTMQDADLARILAHIAIERGALEKGGLPDYEKSAAILMDDFRAGRIGRITLEEP